MSDVKREQRAKPKQSKGPSQKGKTDWTKDRILRKSEELSNIGEQPQVEESDTQESTDMTGMSDMGLDGTSSWDSSHAVIALGPPYVIDDTYANEQDGVEDDYSVDWYEFHRSRNNEYYPPEGIQPPKATSIGIARPRRKKGKSLETFSNKEKKGTGLRKEEDHYFEFEESPSRQAAAYAKVEGEKYGNGTTEEANFTQDKKGKGRTNDTKHEDTEMSKEYARLIDQYTFFKSDQGADDALPSKASSIVEARDNASGKKVAASSYLVTSGLKTRKAFGSPFKPEQYESARLGSPKQFQRKTREFQGASSSVSLGHGETTPPLELSNIGVERYNDKLRDKGKGKDSDKIREKRKGERREHSPRSIREELTQEEEVYGRDFSQYEASPQFYGMIEELGEENFKPWNPYEWSSNDSASKESKGKKEKDDLIFLNRSLYHQNFSYPRDVWPSSTPGVFYDSPIAAGDYNSSSYVPEYKHLPSAHDSPAMPPPGESEDQSTPKLEVNKRNEILHDPEDAVKQENSKVLDLNELEAMRTRRQLARLQELFEGAAESSDARSSDTLRKAYEEQKRLQRMLREEKKIGPMALGANALHKVPRTDSDPSSGVSSQRNVPGDSVHEAQQLIGSSIAAVAALRLALATAESTEQHQDRTVQASDTEARDNRILSCKMCIAVYALWIVVIGGSCAVGFWRTAVVDEGTGFTDAAFVVAIGGVIVFPIQTRHFEQCRERRRAHH